MNDKQKKPKKKAAKKTKKSTKSKAGRPKFAINMRVVKAMANGFSTQQDIANELGCSVDTLQRSKEFCGTYKRSYGFAKNSIRRLQMVSAKKGNVSILIFLGKNYLGQSDNPIDMDELKIPNPIVINIANTDKPKVHFRAEHEVKDDDDGDYETDDEPTA